jgi:hypothetical protein
VLNDAPLAKLFDCSVSFNGYRTVLNVQLLKASAVIGNILDALIGDHLATFDAQFFQAGAKFRKSLQAQISNVTFSNV